MPDPNFVISEPLNARNKYRISGTAKCLRFINFATGSAILAVAHKTAVDEILKSIEPSGQKIYIVGHASGLGHGHFDNKALSRQRANAVFGWFSVRTEALKDLGVLVSTKYEVFAEGDTETIGNGPNDPRDRAVVVIIQDAEAPRPVILPPGQTEPQIPNQNDEISIDQIVSVLSRIFPRKTPWTFETSQGFALSVKMVGGGGGELFLKNERTPEKGSLFYIGAGGSVGPLPGGFSFSTTKMFSRGVGNILARDSSELKLDDMAGPSVILNIGATAAIGSLGLAIYFFGLADLGLFRRRDLNSLAQLLVSVTNVGQWHNAAINAKAIGLMIGSSKGLDVGLGSWVGLAVSRQSS